LGEDHPHTLASAYYLAAILRELGSMSRPAGSVRTPCPGCVGSWVSSATSKGPPET
jgi:hypothetical protein